MKHINKLRTNLISTFLSLSRTKRTVLIAVLGLVLLIGIRIGGKEEVDTIPLADNVRHVSVLSVGELSQHATPLSLLGTVTSRSEATIRAEASGKIVAVYKRLGDYVGAGTVIAEFENSGERAQVLQAEGAYEAASAGKDIATINLGSSDTALFEAKSQAISAIKSGYTSLDDAVRTKTDPAWKNPQTRDAKLSVTVPDAKLIIELEEARTKIETMLVAREARNATLTVEADLVQELVAVEGEANVIKDYLDNLSLAFNRALADGSASTAAIESYKASTGLARGSVGGVISTIAGTRNALNASMTTNQVAGKNASSLGANSGSATDAQIKSALGNLRGAQARLEKTIVRSPISGTINSLAINTGDFVSPFTEIAIISNNGALEVVAYVTEDDARELGLGSKVTIEGGATGVITRIAPALDPKTKKIEVRIGISGGTASLINGQSVRVEATRKTRVGNSTGQNKLPLSAIKVTPTGAVVFSVSADNKLIAHAVTLGALQGPEVAITAGVTTDMQIVVDVRGLQEGMTVATN